MARRKDGRPRSLPIFDVEFRREGVYAKVEVPGETRGGMVGGYSVEESEDV